MGLFSSGSDSGSSDDDTDGGGSRFWQERGFVASAIVVGAVVVCVLVWVFARGSDTPTSQPTETPSTVAPTEQPTEEPSVPPATPTEQPTDTTTPSSPPPINSETGGCHNKNPDMRIPRVAAPPAVTWQFEAGMLIPLQVAGGPAATATNGVRSCFAHSPTGAVLATLVMLGQIRNPDLTVDVLTARVMPGPGRNRAIADARAPQTPEAVGAVQFAGFKFIEYTPSKAIIQVAAEFGDKGVAALPVTMVWNRGDWKALLQEDGSFSGEVAPDVLQTLDGYVRFSGA